MRSRDNKISAKNPRRSTQRLAKTMALSALTSKMNITPTRSRYDNKYLPKKRWKAKRQLSAAAEVTPQEKCPIIATPAIQEYTPMRTKVKSMILAKLDLDGAFRVHETMANGSTSFSSSGIKRLKVTTSSSRDCSEPFPVNLFNMVESATMEYPSICHWSIDGSCIEIDATNPALLQILRKHFKHSRWLSFSRQLNNYGFVSKGPRQNKPKFRVYHHPHFYRNIRDPNTLVALVPYLPGMRKRDKLNKIRIAALAAESTRTKRTRRVLATKSPKELSACAKTVTPMATLKNTGGLKTAPTSGSKATTRSAKKPKQASKNAEKDSTAVVDFMKTPSPKYRNAKAKFMSSPPPLSHYLQPKNVPTESNSNGTKVSSSAKLSSSNESPLPSSLLTVNFVMSPSSLLKYNNNEPTPRASNLSSSQSSPLSQDGFQMLSWAAQAVESPQTEYQQHFHSPNGKTGMRFLQALDCSPIVPSTNSNKGSLAEAIHRCCPPSESSTSTFSASPAICSDNIGPSPLSFRGHHDTESELELLRNCLEDVFMTSIASGSGNSASGGSIVNL